jgi:hypothetical protein
MKNILNPKQIFSASVLSIFLIGGAIAIPARKPFGLGVPISSGTGGAVRSISNSLLIPLAPEDGGRTASDRPTFYWYLPSSNNFPYKAVFTLRDPANQDGATVFRAEGIADKSGLYKVTIPANAPALKPEKVYVWQLRLRGSTASSDLQTLGSILFSKTDKEVEKAIAQAPTNLEKAKIYTNNGYWFDALNLYTNQIAAQTDTEPKPATTMRSEMILEVFTNKNSEPQAIASVKNLIENLNKSNPAELSPLKP